MKFDVSVLLFFVSFLSLVVNCSNLISIFIAIEIMLLSISIKFIKSSVLFDDMVGQFFVLIILTVAAAEIAIGLSLAVVYYRVQGSLELDTIKNLKG